MQCACRRFHSSETAVMKMFNDLLLAADADQMSALCLLDLTAASQLRILKDNFTVDSLSPQ